jgi:Rrf2 family transcriptional regulator, nitric oxide-sensitive transcriptional repressor
VRLTTFTDYSLRVLIHVASAPEGRSTIAEAARALDVSEHHLVKVAHVLGKIGVLVNARGRGGGLRLAGPPSSISLARVVQSTESIRIAECFDAPGNTCALVGKCRLETVLHEAVEAFHGVLARYTLQDLIVPPRPAGSTRAWPILGAG